ncbi:hypothetical protein G6045_32190 [Streptomyces sp. YC504]|uniref:Uncharacterized protein n=1 Tax=Streptomyces mesophilus TaxID=1775132 RepID=A0A6G4XTZ9_9ACTN|nr:hypothetical protein [Streptomyces mesophilus]NGO80287.1 hypothetical protein [Streptomyces mesophilus]
MSVQKWRALLVWEDKSGRWSSERTLTSQEWAVWHVLCEIWALQWLLPESEVVEESEDEQAEEQMLAAGALLLAQPNEPWTGPQLALTPYQQHLLVQLRLLAELVTPEPPASAVKTTAQHAAPDSRTTPQPGVSTPPASNLDCAGLAAPPSLFDALLTLAAGVVQVLIGFHVVGALAAMAHGAFKVAAPDSPLTEIAGVVRKALTPHLTVIQESIKMMAPLPDNERSGLRDTFCLATHQITGGDVGALKHQLFPPRDTGPSANPSVQKSCIDAELSPRSSGQHAGPRTSAEAGTDSDPVPVPVHEVSPRGRRVVHEQRSEPRPLTDPQASTPQAAPDSGASLPSGPGTVQSR